MPFKQTRVPRYLILDEPPRRPGWRAILLTLVLLSLLAFTGVMLATP